MINGFSRTRRRLAIAAAAVAAVTAAGCGTAPSAPPTDGGLVMIMIREDANGTTVPVAVGGGVELILPSRYWDVDGSSSSSPRVLRQDGPATPMPRPSSCLANIRGDRCIQIQMKFTALAAGKAIITASRISCGEAMLCGPDQARFTVTIVVRNLA